jgi:hypothetical protein
MSSCTAYDRPHRHETVTIDTSQLPGTATSALAATVEPVCPGARKRRGNPPLWDPQGRRRISEVVGLTF